MLVSLHSILDSNSNFASRFACSHAYFITRGPLCELYFLFVVGFFNTVNLKTGYLHVRSHIFLLKRRIKTELFLKNLIQENYKTLLDEFSTFHFLLSKTVKNCLLQTEVEVTPLLPNSTFEFAHLAREKTVFPLVEGRCSQKHICGYAFPMDQVWTHPSLRLFSAP